LPAKARNQVRKGQKQPFTVHWGGEPLLADFYEVFSRNMRDPGTPVPAAGPAAGPAHCTRDTVVTWEAIYPVTAYEVPER